MFQYGQYDSGGDFGSHFSMITNSNKHFSGHLFSYDYGEDFGSHFSIITNLNKYFSGHLFSYDYVEDFGSHFSIITNKKNKKNNDTFSVMTMVGTTEASSEAVSQVSLERPGSESSSSLLMRFNLC